MRTTPKKTGTDEMDRNQFREASYDYPNQTLEEVMDYAEFLEVQLELLRREFIHD